MKQPTILSPAEHSRLEAMMPTRFCSLDDLPSIEELADLSDEDLFEEIVSST